MSNASALHCGIVVLSFTRDYVWQENLRYTVIQYNESVPVLCDI